MQFSLIPRSFFIFVPIQTGAEIIAACLVFNKASAPYGLGAIFTGKGLTPMQWIMNAFSLTALPVAVWGYSSVHYRKPLRSLIYTHFYLLDTFIALGFTIFFIIFWFAVEGRAKNNPPQVPEVAKRFVPAITALLTRREVSSSTTTSYAPAQAKATGVTPFTTLAASADSASGMDESKSATGGEELAMTVVTTTLFLLVRFYFGLVLIGHSRSLVRQTNLRPYNGEPDGSFRAKVQYALLKPLENFWTGHVTRPRRRSTFGPAETRPLAYQQ